MKKLATILTSFLAFICIIGVAQAYTVQRGDTLSQIAVNADLSLTELLKQNPQITNPNLIYPGQEVTLGKEETLGAATSPVAGVTYTLAGSGITASATSITLQSLTIPQTGRELVDSDFSDTFYITAEPGNNKRQEIIACTTVVQNANDTATLSGCSRGMLPFSPFTASTTYAFTHAGGTAIIFSDPPQLFNEFAAKGNQETITAPWTFNQYPQAGALLGSATNSLQFVTLGQASAIGIQGAATSTEGIAGICRLATQAQMAMGTDLGANDPLCLQAKYATSTPGNGITGNYIPVTLTNGKLKQTFWDLTESFTFSKLNSITATTTNATSTGVYTFNVVSSTTSTLLQANIGAVDIKGGQLNSHDINTLATNSTTPANEFHYHQSSCEVKSYSFASGDTVAGGTVLTFAHTLGVRPTSIVFTAMAGMPAGNAFSVGTWTSSTNFTSQFTVYSNNAQIPTDNLPIASVIQLINDDATVESSATMISPTNTRQFSITVGTNVNTAPNAARRFTATLCK